MTRDLSETILLSLWLNTSKVLVHQSTQKFYSGRIQLDNCQVGKCCVLRLSMRFFEPAGWLCKAY
eukprot:2271490-Pleurochrysis_carterae.AAC.1